MRHNREGGKCLLRGEVAAGVRAELQRGGWTGGRPGDRLGG